MPVSTSMNVQIAALLLSQMKAIVVFFAHLEQLNVHQYKQMKVAANFNRCDG